MHNIVYNFFSTCRHALRARTAPWPPRLPAGPPTPRAQPLRTRMHTHNLPHNKHIEPGRDNTDFTPPSPRDYSRSEPSSRAPSTVAMGDGDDSDATICISDDGGGVDGVFDVFQDNGSDEDELD